jgi:hypothetical protein
MHVAQASRFLLLIVVALVCGCQSAPPASSPTAAPAVNPIVGCERTCSTNYDSCMDVAQAGVPANPGAPGAPASPAQDPVAMCQDQLRACFRQCLN